MKLTSIDPNSCLICSNDTIDKSVTVDDDQDSDDDGSISLGDDSDDDVSVFDGDEDDDDDIFEESDPEDEPKSKKLKTLSGKDFQKTLKNTDSELTFFAFYCNVSS